MNIIINTDLIERIGLEIFDISVAELAFQLEAAGAEYQAKDIAEILRVHTRTVSVAAERLEAAGILKSVPDGLKVLEPYRNLKLGKNSIQTRPPVDSKAKERATVAVDEVSEEIDHWIDLWNKLFKCRAKPTAKMKRQIRARRRRYTKVEVYNALVNRSRSEWLRNEGREHLANWDSFWRSDDKVHNYLHLPKTKQTIDSAPKNGYIEGTIN